jgi:hypothetical protein
MLRGVHLTLMMGPITFEPVPAHLIDALTHVEVTNSAGDRSGFQLTFSVSANSRIQRELLPSGFFDPPRRVIIVATVNGTPHVLMDGVITRQELNISGTPGESTLTVTGSDLTQVMDLIDFSFISWPAMPAEVRVLIILAKYAAYGIVPLIIPSVLNFVPNPLEQIPRQEGTDLSYVRELAARTGYVFYIEPGLAPGLNTAYWGPEIKVGEPQAALSVNHDGGSNVDALNFSFDGLSKTLFLLYIQESNSGSPIPIPVPDITPLNPPLGLKPPIPLSYTTLNRSGRREEDEDDTANMHPVEAAARALARASKASDVITASGSLDVTRYGRVLKARQLVGVRGAGIAYDGHYFVKSVTHSLRRGEYKQNFTLTRNAHISLTQTLPP